MNLRHHDGLLVLGVSLGQLHQSVPIVPLHVQLAVAGLEDVRLRLYVLCNLQQESFPILLRSDQLLRWHLTRLGAGVDPLPRLHVGHGLQAGGESLSFLGTRHGAQVVPECRLAYDVHAQEDRNLPKVERLPALAALAQHPQQVRGNALIASHAEALQRGTQRLAADLMCLSVAGENVGDVRVIPEGSVDATFLANFVDHARGLLGVVYEYGGMAHQHQLVHGGPRRFTHFEAQHVLQRVQHLVRVAQDGVGQRRAWNTCDWFRLDFVVTPVEYVRDGC
mmetsp:Transcript_29724/g.65870  ORF Transcript_29724/g.65870 Transcript_29724/m.65870 type:complete len:279 (+) Transcript_29724:2228-3064(+)